MTTELWLTLGLYLLLSYTLFWRLFIWWTDLPKPVGNEQRACAAFLWLITPLFPFGVFGWVTEKVLLCLSGLCIWIAYGGRK